MLLTCAVLLVVVAVVVAGGVVPQVLETSAPGIDPDAAVPAFRVAVGLHLLAAAVLASLAIWSMSRTRGTTVLLILTGVAVVLFGLVLADAAVAFLEAGSALQMATILLWACVAADIVAGALAIATATLRSTQV